MSLNFRLRFAVFASALHALPASAFNGCSTTRHASHNPHKTRTEPAARLAPVVNLDALPVSALIHAPPDIPAASHHDHFHVVEIGNRRLRPKFQPRRIRLAPRAPRP